MMNIFGIGAPEMVLILVAALVIFGPGKLPEVMGQLGKAVRDFRRMTTELTGEFEKAVGDPNEIKRALTGELDGVKSTVTGATASAKRELNQVSTTVGKTVSGAAKSATGTAAKTTTKTSTTAKTTTAAKPATTAAGGTKPASSGTATAAKAAEKAPPPKATKADPLADVFVVESEAAAPPAAKPVTRAAATPAAPATPARPAPVTVTRLPGTAAGANGRAAAPEGDPLARARQRRLSAGYGAGSRGSNS
jgi:TatA/E family protein of Tat protein translocase